jgi:DNA (cytosine-5)-methyltransferase 1
VSCSRCDADRMILRRKAAPRFNHDSADLRLFDLFSGCGGLSAGLLLAAMELRIDVGVALAVERDDAPATVYEANTGAAVDRLEVERLIDGRLGAALTPSEKALKKRVGQVQIGLAGPPCQGHSDLNNHTRRNDPRNRLYERVARAAAVLEPSLLVVENVPAIQNDHGRVLELTRRALEGLGYSTADTVVDMRKVGIPQRRRRHLLIASLEASIDPATTVEALTDHPCSDHLPRTVDWAIGDLDGLQSQDVYDTPSKRSEENRRRIAYLFSHRRYDLPMSERPKCHRDGDHTYNSMYGRLSWDKPAQTITGGFGSMGQGRFVHPQRWRTLTPHEAARLQTLPDWFSFSSTSRRTQLARMIGNAVPPFLGMTIGQLLLPALSSTVIAGTGAEESLAA